MSEQLKQEIAVMTNNTIRIGFFIALAMVFDKWWIALFSGLFLMGCK